MVRLKSTHRPIIYPTLHPNVPVYPQSSGSKLPNKKIDFGLRAHQIPDKTQIMDSKHNIVNEPPCKIQGNYRRCENGECIPNIDLCRKDFKLNFFCSKVKFRAFSFWTVCMWQTLKNCHEFWNVKRERDFIFRMHTQLMKTLSQCSS